MGPGQPCSGLATFQSVRRGRSITRLPLQGERWADEATPCLSLAFGGTTVTLPQPAASGLESIHLGGKDLPSLALGREIHSFPRTPARSILLFLRRFAIQRPAALRCPRRGLICLSHLEVPGGALTLSRGGAVT